MIPLDTLGRDDIGFPHPVRFQEAADTNNLSVRYVLCSVCIRLGRGLQVFES